MSRRTLTQAGPNLRGRAKIIAAINASEAVVVLVSQNSDGSQWVHQEIGCAVHAKKLIIPLVQPGTASETLAMLQGVEYIPFDFANPHEGHMHLRTALQKLVAKQLQKQVAKEQRDTALLALACVALVLLTLEAS